MKNPKNPKKSSKRVSHDEFVRIWQASASASEAARKAGVTAYHASFRAYFLRKRGVPLKRFAGGRRPLDVKKLAKLAKSLQPSAGK